MCIRDRYCSPQFLESLTVCDGTQALSTNRTVSGKSFCLQQTCVVVTVIKMTLPYFIHNGSNGILIAGWKINAHQMVLGLDYFL